MNIVSGVGIRSVSKSSVIRARVEQAMQNAVLKCIEEGITDSTIQRERMMAARERVRLEMGL